MSLAVRDLLSLYKYDGDNIPIIRGSALAAATGGDPTIGKDAILALMRAVRPRPFVYACLYVCLNLARNLRWRSFHGRPLDKPQGD